jgi:hypothetical protein
MLLHISLRENCRNLAVVLIVVGVKADGPPERVFIE